MSLTYFTVESRETKNQDLRELITFIREIIFKIVIDHKENIDAADT
jgi:hypothetical protein